MSVIEAQNNLLLFISMTINRLTNEKNDNSSHDKVYNRLRTETKVEKSLKLNFIYGISIRTT
jgi:hypothetical protein